MTVSLGPLRNRHQDGIKHVEILLEQKSLGKKMSHVRLRECSDCDASLTLNEVKGEWTFRKFQQGHWGGLYPKSSIRGVSCLLGRAPNSNPCDAHSGARSSLREVWPWLSEPAPWPLVSYTPCSWNSARCILMADMLMLTSRRR